MSITGHRKPRTTKVFFLLKEKGKGAGGGGVDYRSAINSSEFLVCFSFSSLSSVGSFCPLGVARPLINGLAVIMT